jgi:hypothetical protein
MYRTVPSMDWKPLKSMVSGKGYRSLFGGSCGAILFQEAGMTRYRRGRFHYCNLYGMYVRLGGQGGVSLKGDFFQIWNSVFAKTDKEV